MTQPDPVSVAREALTWAKHHTYMQDEEELCRAQIDRALSALSRLPNHESAGWGVEHRVFVQATELLVADIKKLEADKARLVEALVWTLDLLGDIGTDLLHPVEWKRYHDLLAEMKDGET